MTEERQPDEVLRARKWLKTYERPLKHRTSWISTTDVMNSLSTSELSEMLAAFAQSIQAEARAQVWIKCSERLPDSGKVVLFAVIRPICESVEMGWLPELSDGERRWQSVETAPQDEPIYFDLEQVTHWRELPAPPALEPK